MVEIIQADFASLDVWTLPRIYRSLNKLYIIRNAIKCNPYIKHRSKVSQMCLSVYYETVALGVLGTYATIPFGMGEWCQAIEHYLSIRNLIAPLVLAVPQTVTSPATTVTLYDVIPSQQVSLLNNNSNARLLDGTYELTATIIGVSSGSEGSETTYSFGRYFSQNAVFKTTSTDSRGKVTTET
ncbi:hypothetical protein GYMLUDRAFT_494637 [Collybiopsis luxurians FD-317 M1]|uniref:Uncharacterized protein n=1 Tax=Collybiopsis luxurians FD-317 M1 TaxID=944289 RepID=A0A0D0B7P1_9AGAR|nr:hypothetical protein GYMLUDRAFT_494637 [Collybiopsis luxurians FD-317 M1]